MSDDDALRDDMRRLGRYLDRDPLDLDEGTAERLLAGTLDPADAPPAYAAVAQVLAVAAAPPRPEELAGEAEALARFRERAAARPLRAGRQLARFGVVAAVLVGLVSGGGVGFATGVLPRTGQWLNRTVQSVVGTTPASVAPPRTEPGSSTSTLLGGRGGPAAPATTPGSVQSPSSSGLPASTAAAEELCTAWQAGKGKNMDPAALRALAAAAGGSDNIPAYCHAVKKGQNQGGSPKPGDGNGGGDGNGQGGGGQGLGASQATPGAASQATPGAASQATPGAASRSARGAGG